MTWDAKGAIAEILRIHTPTFGGHCTCGARFRFDDVGGWYRHAGEMVADLLGPWLPGGTDASQLRLVIPPVGMGEHGAKVLEGHIVASGRMCGDHGMGVLIVVTPDVAAHHGTMIPSAEVRDRVNCIAESMGKCLEMMYPGISVARVQIEKYVPPPGAPFNPAEN